MWKKWNKKHKAGFSLLELIIAIAVIGIITGVSVTSLIDTRSGNALNGAQREVVSAIKLAQNFALQGKTQIQSGSSKVPCGYGFVVLSETSYAIFHNFLQSGINDCETQNRTQAYTKYSSTISVINDTNAIISGVKFDAGDAAIKKSFYFSVPMGQIHGTLGAILSSSVDIGLSMGSKSKTVTVGSGGAVEETN